MQMYLTRAQKADTSDQGKVLIEYFPRFYYTVSLGQLLHKDEFIKCLKKLFSSNPTTEELQFLEAATQASYLSVGRALNGNISINY